MSLVGDGQSRCRFWVLGVARLSLLCSSHDIFLCSLVLQNNKGRELRGRYIYNNTMEWMHPWKGVYRERIVKEKTKTMDGDGESFGCQSLHHHMGVHQCEGDALETLLHHYPWIVYLGFSFWRKLLLSFVTPHQHRSTFVDDETGKTYETLPSLQQSYRHASRGPDDWHHLLMQHVGLAGDIRVFTKVLVPPDVLEQGAELTQDRCSIPYQHGTGFMPRCCGADFLIGLIKANQLDVISLLVSDLRFDLAGAWSFRETFNGSTFSTCAIHFACDPMLDTSRYYSRSNDNEGIPLLLVEKHGRDSFTNFATPLHDAAGAGFVKAVMKLVQDCNADPNARAPLNKDETPLHWASSAGHANVVAFLLSLEKVQEQVNAMNALGETALYLAVKGGHRGVAEILVSQRGIDLDDQI